MIAGLPYDAEVEYLQTVSRAYIETGIIPPSSSIVKWCGYVGFASGSTNRRFLYADQNQSVAHYSEINGSDRYGGGASYAQVQLSPETMYFATTEVTASRNSVEIEVDGVKYQASSTSYASTEWGQIVLFRLNNNYIGEGQRLGSTRIYVNDELKRDFIPVRFTNSNGQSEGAMYDRVSRKLFRNAGTGSFTIGPDVAIPVMGLHFMRRPRYTARDYVQTGLIAMWDGEWNAGPGVHDANATVWKDLVGNCHLDDLFVDPAYSPTSGFGDDYWWFTGGMSRWRKQNSTITYKTAELVSFQPNEQYTSFCGGSENYNLGGYFGSVVMGSSSSPYPSISRNTDSVSVYSYTIGTEGDSSTYTAYRDGSLISNGVLGAGNNYVADEVAIGTVVRRQLFVTPRIYCVRLYSRALTAEEIAHNYAVDKERFNLP